MARKQVRKGYDRHQEDKQLDREKIRYQKAERKGIMHLMNENQQLKEEIALLDQQYGKDQTVIRHQAEYITLLEKKLKQAYHLGGAVAGLLVAVAAALIITLTLWRY
jgi:hypothetical protein